MKKIIKTDKAPAAIGPYSQAVQTGNIVFISGQVAINPKTGELSGDIKEQAAQVFENIKAVLESQGLTTENVVKTTVFLTDMNDFQTVNEVYAEYFKEDCPARSAVAVCALPKGAKIECEAIAAV